MYSVTRYAYHHSVNARIDKSKHPDWRTHVTHTSPHTKHGASVVISLQSRASLSLGQDDHGIDDFIEFAQVEEPAPKCQTFVPDSAYIRRIWCEHVCTKMDQAVSGSIAAASRVVHDRIAVTTRTLNLA